MPLNQDFTDIHTHISAALPFISRVARGNFSLQQMEKICPSRSCRNLIPPNSCLALNKHEVREAPVSNQSRRQTFLPTCMHMAIKGGFRLCVCVCRGLESLIMVLDLMRLMCACLHHLMASATSCRAKSSEPSCRKSPVTCCSRLHFDTTPLVLEMT